MFLHFRKCAIEEELTELRLRALGRGKRDGNGVVKLHCKSPLLHCKSIEKTTNGNATTTYMLRTLGSVDVEGSDVRLQVHREIGAVLGNMVGVIEEGR